MIICLNIILKDNLMKEELNNTIINASSPLSRLNNNLIKDYYSVTGIPVNFQNKVIEFNKALENYPSDF